MNAMTQKSARSIPTAAIRIEVDSHVVVMGLGISGYSAARFCLAQGARVSVSEHAPMDHLNPNWYRELMDMGVFFETGGHTRDLFESADLVLVSPGVPSQLPILQAVRERGVPVVGEMALAESYLRTPMIAVTGTNGKTTVTTLLGQIFQACGKRVFVGGNIGTPLTDYLRGMQECDAVILEVSSFQLDTAPSIQPHVAILLNITADHLDRYSSFAAYAASKCRLLKNQGAGDVAIVNADDAGCMKYLSMEKTSLRHGWAERSTLFYGMNVPAGRGAVLQDEKVQLVYTSHDGRKVEESYDLSRTALNRPPNRGNCAAALLAARSMGCDPEGIKKALHTFAPLAHRLTLVAKRDGVRFLDDSKATNVGAVQSALASCTGPVLLIAGGREKGGSYEPLKKGIAEKVKALFLIGEAAPKMTQEFQGVTVVHNCDSLEMAVHRAWQCAETGDTVLLSPACASFDMFKSYAERGECFGNAVRALPPRGS